MTGTKPPPDIFQSPSELKPQVVPNGPIQQGFIAPSPVYPGGGADSGPNPQYNETTPASANGDIEFIMNGGGATLATGIQGELTIDFPCTIVSATLLGDQEGSIVVDIWEVPYSGFPGSDANSIVASDPPTITEAQKSRDTTLTGWTTAIVPPATLQFNIDSVTVLTRCTLTLGIIK